ncbi:discoidin domain-containing protein, partial [Planctomycetota bacterium]
MLRRPFHHMTTLLLIILLAGNVCAETNAPLKELSLTGLEQRLTTIDSALEQLAHYSLRSGIGAIGYRSLAHETADHPEWVHVELDRDYPIQEIVLVPTIWRDTEKGFQSDGFPTAFRILAGTAGDHTGTVVAEYRSADNIQPGIAPLVIPINEISASWVRVEVQCLSTRAFDRKHAFQLAELMVFSHTENVALRQSVETSTIRPGYAGAWDQRFLVDGFLPYLMDSAQGSQSLAYVSPFGEKPTLTLDLGQSYALSRIHLHAVDQSDTVPQAYAGDLGIPYHLKIEGANHADFSDVVTLLDYRRESINDTGPILMWRIGEQTCRYVRLFEGESDHSPEIRPGQFRIGFAEIEFFSKGQNIALGKPARSSRSLKIAPRSLDALTDGNNLYGKILPLRAWMK